MGSQVSNWVYDKKDYALRAINMWSITQFTGDTLAKVLQKLSTESSINSGRSELLHDGDFEVMIRPFTGSLGGDYGSKTGCATFKIVGTSPYNAQIDGLYGTISLNELIKQVFIACGVVVEESHLNEYIDAVRLQMGYLSTPKHTGVLIKKDNGLLKSYVLGGLIQNIINAMDAADMFNRNSNPIIDISDITETGVYQLEEAPSYNYNMIKTLVFEAAQRALSYNPAVVNPDPLYLPEFFYETDAIEVTNRIMTLIEELDLPYDFNACTIIAFVNQSSSYISTGTRYDFYFTFSDYESSINVTNIYRDGGAGSYENDAIQFNTGTHTYARTVTYLKNRTTHQATIADSANTQYNRMYGGWLYGSAVGSSSSCSVGTFSCRVQEEGPEGISYEVGAIIPTHENHSITSLYPEWDYVTQQEVSMVNHTNISSATFFAINFSGDTQYNTQLGTITTNTMLQHLGVYVVDTNSYDPVNPSDEDDVIIPDVMPDPNDTPEAEYPDSDTPSSKYMVSVWNLNDAMMQNFASALWSTGVWNAIKDFFTKPTDAVISLFTLYGVDVGTGATAEEIKLGGHGTNVYAEPVTIRYKTVDLGTVNVPEFYSNVEDYAPYSSAEIYLPFIGFVKVDVNEIMNSTVGIKYVFDVWTGMLVARIFVTRDNVTQELYNFTGSSGVQIPLTDRDYTNALSSLITGTFDTLRNVGIASGIAAATGGTGFVPALTALSGGLNTLSNYSHGIKNAVQRSGSIGNTFGVMTNKKACIYIKRPLAYNAYNYEHYYGFPANWTCTLSEVHGYTRVKDIHLDTVSCTDEERLEIEKLLKEGVML